MIIAGTAGMLALPLSQTILAWLTRGLAVVLLLRTIGDFRLVGFFKGIRHTRFARLDTAVYSPLCLALAIGTARRVCRMSLRRPSCRIVAIEQVKATPDDWVWTYHRSPEHLRHNRINVLGRFIADYEAGKKAGRYVVGESRLLDARAGSVNAIESQADHEDERGGSSGGG